MVFPLDLIITRLQVQRQLRKNSSIPHDDEYRGIRDAAQKIYTQEGGISGFYIGVAQDTAASVADSFLFFLGYNFLRQRRLQARVAHKSLPVLDELGIGFLAGALAKLLTTPIANIVTRKQTSAMVAARENTTSQPPSPSVRDIALQIRDEKGLQGFWSGYSASLILTLNPSLTFFFHELLRRTLLPQSRRDKPAASATFLLAAVSKAIASTITYPFSLAKARAQASASKVEDNEAEVKKGIEEISAGATTGSKPTRAAARKTVFSTILQIARTEGVEALYEGLSGQVLKGFFSHGITMLVKEAVHKLIIQLYFFILKALKQYPSPQELAENASLQTKAAANEAGDRAQNIAVTLKEGGRTITDRGQEIMQNGQAKAHGIYQSGKEQVGNLYERGMQQGQGLYDGASKRAGVISEKGQKGAAMTGSAAQSSVSVTAQSAKDLYQRGADEAAGVYETTKSGASPINDTTNSTAQKTKDLYQRGADQAADTYAKSRSSASSIQNTAVSTAQNAKDLYQRGADQASDAYNKSESSTPSISKIANMTTQTAQDLYQRSTDQAAEAYRRSKENSSAIQDTTNTTAKSVADYVGRRTEEAGKSMRPDSVGKGKE